MMKRGNRLTAFLLTIAMVVTLLPLDGFKAEAAVSPKDDGTHTVSAVLEISDTIRHLEKMNVRKALDEVKVSKGTYDSNGDLEYTEHILKGRPVAWTVSADTGWYTRTDNYHTVTVDETMDFSRLLGSYSFSGSTTVELIAGKIGATAVDPMDTDNVRYITEITVSLNNEYSFSAYSDPTDETKSRNSVELDDNNRYIYTYSGAKQNPETLEYVSYKYRYLTYSATSYIPNLYVTLTKTPTGLKDIYKQDDYMFHGADATPITADFQPDDATKRGSGYDFTTGYAELAFVYLEGEDEYVEYIHLSISYPASNHTYEFNKYMDPKTGNRRDVSSYVYDSQWAGRGTYYVGDTRKTYRYTNINFSSSYYCPNLYVVMTSPNSEVTGIYEGEKYRTEGEKISVGNLMTGDADTKESGLLISESKDLAIEFNDGSEVEYIRISYDPDDENSRISSYGYMDLYDNSGNQIVSRSISAGQNGQWTGSYATSSEVPSTKFRVYPNFYGSYDDEVSAVFAGNVASLDDATSKGLTDIKSDLFGTGYQADYSGGADFTIFFKEELAEGDNVMHFNVKFTIETYTPSEPTKNPYSELDYQMPHMYKEDPFFHVTGFAETENADDVEVFVVQNNQYGYGYNLNLDSNYSLGYQTLFIYDPNNKVDIGALTPIFGSQDDVNVRVTAKKVNAEGKEEDEEQISGETKQDFSKGYVDYNVIYKNFPKRYTVNVVKVTDSAKLFVESRKDPTDATNKSYDKRGLSLDGMYSYQHDILIANIGKQDLTGLKVYLDEEAKKYVDIDSYWHIGDETATKTLSGFSTATADKYGAIDNIAKVRIVPKDSTQSDKIQGNLYIEATNQDKVTIPLSGLSGNPRIDTGSDIVSGVKYVPYSKLVTTNNIYDWNYVTYKISKGKLPYGLSISETSGEITGTPKESGTFTFSVRATSSYTKFGYAEQEFNLVIADNTNDDVYNASDTKDGYGIETPIGTKVGATNEYELYVDEMKSTVDFASDKGLEYFTYEDEHDDAGQVWLDGEKLVKGVDYEASEGSTKITIRSSVLATKDLGRHTLVISFRDKDDTGDIKPLKRTAQNVTTKRRNNNTPSTPTETGGSSNNGSGSGNNNSNNGNNTQRDELNQVAANTVSTVIDEIPSVKNIDLNDADAVAAARAAYDALTPEQKALVTNYGDLVKAENRIAKLQTDKKKADKVTDKIDKLPKNPTEDDTYDIVAAREAYRSLTNSQKSMVDKKTVNKLKKAEKAVGITNWATATAEDASGVTSKVKVSLLPKNKAILQNVKAKKGSKTVTLPTTVKKGKTEYEVTRLSSRFLKKASAQGIKTVRLQSAVYFQKATVTNLSATEQKKMKIVLTSDLTKAEQRTLRKRLTSYGFKGKVVLK